MDNDNMQRPGEDTEAYPTITMEEICDIVESAPRMLILSHVNPDGDTIGSAFALRCMVEAAGGSARCICPGTIPRRLRFLTLAEEDLEMCAFAPEELDSVTEQYDVICSVDVASPGQLGELACLLPHIDFMLDHHAIGTPFAPYLTDADASACGELLYDLYALMQSRSLFTECPPAARRLYAAIVSDTGSFKFSNTTPKTHLIAAGLVHAINTAADDGPDTAALCRSLFGQRTLRELQAQMLTIASLRFYEEGALGAVLLTQKMLMEAELTEEDVGTAVDTPRSVEGVLIGISIRQSAEDPTRFKVSSRANVDCDCVAVCSIFGGGGHVRAAGCTLTADSPEEALRTAVSAFSQAIRAYKERT